MCSTQSNAELQPTASDPALILELKTRRPPSLEGRPGCETWSVDFSPDGAWFAWSMGHGIVWVVAWPLDSEECQDGGVDRGDKSFSCGHPVWGLAFGPRPPKATAARAKPAPKGNNSLLLATGLENGVIKIWNVLTGVAVFDLHGHEGVVRHLAFPRNGTLTLVSSSRDKTLRIWDLAHKGKKVHVLLGHKDWISCCSVSPDCSMIATVGRFDRMVCLWSLRSYTFIRNLTGGDHKTLYLLSSCDFSPDGALLATAAFSGASWWIDLWDPYTAEKLATLVDYFEGYGQNQLSSIQFSPNGLHLSIVTEKRPLCIWEPGKPGMVMQTRADRDSNGLCCNYHPQGGVVATGTRDGHVRFWKAPRTVPNLRHLCRSILRHSVSTHQMEPLPLPKRILEYLTYRDIPDCFTGRRASSDTTWRQT
ncbi:WD repeat and SOCS box-containing protein 2-like [Nerophis lumbriciformis]|uniref:WD repeat and SOCS box-containing protein 2-like n=1 Tax=Nerophis lumbriciformis TaxID=546530 RepID=UPI002ADF5C04|nr:WD repeat and SOCS box-containing protein 2-like [Nerophis lumbriciformis]XP_061788524.1 WD repeat and SOCS box-containing protein 2-like [Nerophis lumbriciformis]